MSDVGPYKKITPKDFEKVALFAGKIAQVKRHPTLKTHYVLLVDCTAQDEDYQIVAELADSYAMQELLGEKVIIVGNLETIKVAGIDSEAMLLVTHLKNKTLLVTADKKTPSGGKVHGMQDGERSFEE